MRGKFRLRRFSAYMLAVAAGVPAVVGVRTYLEFRPAAITLGPATTIYLREHPPVSTRVHEAIHRRQMRDKSTVGRLWSALRYNFDYGYRLDEEAEAKAGEICLQIHKFTAELPAFTTARSRSQAEAYRAWAWERLQPRVPDRVGQQLQHGERCQDILRDVELDLPPGRALSDDDALKLATFHFLQSYGSTEREVATWKARLRLAGYADAGGWEVPDEVPPFGLVGLARPLAPEPDTSVTPVEAGRALQRLTYYRTGDLDSRLLQVDAPYRDRPLLRSDDGKRHVDTALEDWPRELLRRGLRGDLSDDEVAWLEALDAHPVHEDFRTFALGTEADVVGTRYRFAPGTRWDRLPATDLDAIREVFLAQFGRAALAAQQGRLARSDTLVGTALAGALQLVRSGPWEVDVVEGLELTREALGALARVRQARDEDTPWVRDLDDLSGDSWARGPRRMLFSDDPASVYRAMPAIANDPGIPRAFRWFAYRQVVLWDACMARHRAVAATGRHDGWRTSVETGLVKGPGDARLLALMRESMQRLLEASQVAPEEICDPTGVVRPDARMAIMSAPPVGASRALAEEP